MHPLSTTRSDLFPTIPSAGAHPNSRGTASGLVVIGVLLAAVVWGTVAQVRSRPLPGEVGAESAAVAQVD